MKLVIFEGTDRVGKNTQIINCIKNFDSVCIKHWVGPPKNITEKEKQIEYQRQAFSYEFQYWQNTKIKSKNYNTFFPINIIIWNRSHIGEWVYGNLYRGYEPTWIYDLEKEYRFHKFDDIYLIHLWGDSEFILNREDGKSSAQTIEQKDIEIKKFKEAIDRSYITNKLHLKVNNGNNWVEKEKLNENIMNFINK